MDDLNAFERQLRSEVQRAFVPARPVDAASIVGTAATESPKWRFQSMLSATKFVVAGAIVALFGGFMLTGVLTQQPSDDRLPAIGASASATTQAEPTDGATSEPEPTTEVEADTSTTTPDLLPGVDLATEEVEPGVYRVVHDGVRGLRKNVWDVSVTSDGSVWVEKHTPAGPCFGHTAKNSRVVKLGTPGIAVPDIKWDMQSQREPGCQPRVGPRLRFGIVRGVGPVLLRHEEDNREVFVHEDDGWSAATRPAVVACALKADYDASSLIAPDGACWARPNSAKGEAEGQVLAQRVEAGGELTIITPEDVGTEGGLTPVRFATDPDGTVWTGLHTGGSFAGLAGFDGQQWTDVPLTDVAPRVSPDARVVDLVATSDGSVWVAVQSGDRANTRIVRWDGEAWTDRGLVEQARGTWPMPRLFAAPDDSVWLDGRFRFHGDDLERIDLPTGVDAPIVSHAPDGSIWVADGGLYVITPEAVAATER